MQHCPRDPRRLDDVEARWSRQYISRPRCWLTSNIHTSPTGFLRNHPQKRRMSIRRFTEVVADSRSQRYVLLVSPRNAGVLRAKPFRRR